ncbi:MAG: hypothetical protein R3C14_36815 [Caldilineaceae bacterium]
MNQEQLKLILTSLFTNDTDDAEDPVEDEPPCHINQSDIAAYVEAELNGLNARALYPELQLQLHSCPSCRTVYTELRDLFTLEYSGTWAEPPLAPTFDLSFLPAVSAPRAVIAHPKGVEQPEWATIRWVLNEVGQMVVALSAEFIATLQLPQPVYLKGAARDLFEVRSPALAEDLVVTLAAREMRRNPEQCVLTVTAEIPSRGGWPALAGTAVTLSIGATTVAMRQTDAFGKAVFEGIARTDLGDLRLTVAPGVQ